ncbi:Altronate dehydratase (EC [Olavius algarvensis Delta 1 endosymbiont]|nr:Altronate dehydratase (EC [Olavius algarvensis Delta 1 endosymbiont]
MAAPNQLTIRLSQSDNVVVARVDIPAGTEISEEKISCRSGIAFGHKVAASNIKAGQPVKKYGQIIGFASQEIHPGEHVHTHNLSMGDFDRDYAFCADAAPAAEAPAEPETFDGIVRSDGRVATRNYIGVISSVNCSASVCRFIADAFRGEALREFPNIDGVVPITHGTGCGMAGQGEGFEYLLNTIGGYARHPNFGGVLLIGLGCEVMQIDSVLTGGDLAEGKLFHAMTIQDLGGIRSSVDKGTALIREMLPELNRVQRQPVPADRLILGLQCGGSDGYSGITANPALGVASDLLVRNGGTAVLGETPEVYGAEHLLTRRAVSRQVGEKLIDRIQWWEKYTADQGGAMDNNPSPGNKAGGLTTILEKSLGAVAKGGSTNMVDVVKYAQPVAARGFVFMDTPGHDPVSITGMVAGGANIICFTTGRGSVYGCRPVPSIKLATNTAMYDRMQDDMDINCGVTLDGDVSIEDLGEQIFQQILDVASGKRSKSETFLMGDNEFIPWQLGAVM